MDRKTYLNYGGIQLQELLSVKHGIKPVLRTVIQSENITNVSTICKNKGLFCLTKPFIQLYETRFDTPINIIYVSKSKDLLNRAYLSERSGDRRLLGELLGYPSCCVNFFINALKEGEFTYPVKTYLKTNGKPSFLANNVFKMESRLCAEELEIFQKNLEFANRISHLFLISHIPCSYTCRRSIEMGREILTLLDEKEPELAKEIVFTLRRPLLFFDNFNWVIFDGRVNDNTISYASVLPPLSLMEEGILNKFREGDKAKVGREFVIIYKEDKIIHKIKKKHEYDGILLDFS